MTRLVIGTNKAKTTPALVKEVGIIPSGTINITQNGIVDVTNYANANINTPVAPDYYIEKSIDANGKLIQSSSLINLTGVNDVGNNILQYAYYENPNFTNIVIPLKNISGQSGCSSMFYGCSKLASVDLSSLTTINGKNGCSSIFSNCSKLTSVDLSSLTTVGSYGCSSAFYGCSKLTSVDLSSLTSLNEFAFSYTFSNCISLVSIDLSSLTGVYKNCCLSNTFAGCTNLTTVNLSGLVDIYSRECFIYTFYSCNSLTSVDLSSLESTDNKPQGGDSSINVFSYTFGYCRSLTNMCFESLKKVGYNCFYFTFTGCSALKDLFFYALDTDSFGSYTNQFNNMLSSVTGCTVHFPKRIQSTIGSWTSVTGGFSGTNTTVLFDIVTSLTGADGNTYIRKEKESTITATAWTYNNTLYYTSGVSNYTSGINEPSVGDTIYSDATCTTSVTTISSIA